jgi:hypothetical protein
MGLVQLTRNVLGVLINGRNVNLFVEVIALGREIMKVACPRLQLECYLRCGLALLNLQKLDEAEELLHEGLAMFRQEGPMISQVSGIVTQKPHLLST